MITSYRFTELVANAIYAHISRDLSLVHTTRSGIETEIWMCAEQLSRTLVDEDIQVPLVSIPSTSDTLSQEQAPSRAEFTHLVDVSTPSIGVMTRYDFLYKLETAQFIGVGWETVNAQDIEEARAIGRHRRATRYGRTPHE